MNRAYTTVLLDLDHTLLDSDASEAAAYEQTMRSIGVTEPERHFDKYRSINGALWAAVERGEIQPGDVRVTRFQQLTSSLGIAADPEAMADTFVAGLGAKGELYPGAREVLNQLADRAALAMLTNGLSDVQRARIQRLDLARYFDAVVISGEVGTAKPGSGIFDIAFRKLGDPDRSKSLMVGDSLTSDIAGATNYGIPTCWYNPHGKSLPPGTVVTYQIANLAELPAVVDGRERD